MLTQPKSISDLPSVNKGLARNRYVQIAPSRSLANNTFHSGNIHFAFSVSGATQWCPRKSYFRLRVAYTKGSAAGGDDEKQLVVTDDIIPNAFMCGNLFQSCEFRIGGQTVSRCSQNMAQVSALKDRMTKSGIQLNDLGELQNFSAADQRSRQTEITSNVAEGVPYFKVLRSKAGLELCFRPPLSVLDTRGCYRQGNTKLSFHLSHRSRTNEALLFRLRGTKYPM